MTQPETTALLRLSLVALACVACWRILSGVERGARLEEQNRQLTQQLSDERSDLEECRDKVSDALEVLAR